jgi:hypothetical protein
MLSQYGLLMDLHQGPHHTPRKLLLVHKQLQLTDGMADSQCRTFIFTNDIESSSRLIIPRGW